MSTVQARTSPALFNQFDPEYDLEADASNRAVLPNALVNSANDLGRGAFGQEVKDLQQRLANAGFNPGPIDGDFGPLTGAALEAFQQLRIALIEKILAGPATDKDQSQTLSQNMTNVSDEMARGVAGDTTQAMLESFIMPQGVVLEVGSRGRDVEALQQKLSDAGFNPGPVDGIYGPLTDAAVKAFQQNQIAQANANGADTSRLESELENDIVGVATQIHLERAGATEPSSIDVPDIDGPIRAGETSPVGNADFEAQVDALYDAVPADIRRAHPDVREDIERILEVAQQEGLTQEQTAYVIATATHENNLGFYPEELSSGAQYEGRSDLGNSQSGDGVRYKGRGYVQITGRRNYTDWSQRLGIDLVNNPELAADKDIAAQILVIGMKEGTFTGRSLDDYVNDSQSDFTNARRVVNGTDKASLFASSAERYNNALASVPTTSIDEAPTPLNPADQNFILNFQAQLANEQLSNIN